jgi:coenzyme F420-reducing hydrogenase delta subunit
MEEIGLEAERLEMFHMSSSEAVAFKEAVEEMTRRAKELGPTPIKAGQRDRHKSSKPEKAAM